MDCGAGKEEETRVGEGLRGLLLVALSFRGNKKKVEWGILLSNDFESTPALHETVW